MEDLLRELTKTSISSPTERHSLTPLFGRDPPARITLEKRKTKFKPNPELDRYLETCSNELLTRGMGEDVLLRLVCSRSERREPAP